MNKSRTKHFNFLSKRQNRYAIRHFSAGTVSVLVGAAFLLGVHTSDASAAEQDQTSEAKQNLLDASAIFGALTETNEKVAQVTPTEKNLSSVEEMRDKSTTGNGPSITSLQTVEQNNAVQPTATPINDTENSTEAPMKEQSNDAQTTDESNNVTPKNNTEPQANNEISARNAKTTAYLTSETFTTTTSTTDMPTQKQEYPSLENSTNQSQTNRAQPPTMEAPKLAEGLDNLLKKSTFESMYVTTRNQFDKETVSKTKAWPSDVVPENQVEILADAIQNGYIKSVNDVTNKAHTLSGRAWMLDHGTPTTIANGLTPVPEGTKVYLRWIDQDGATSPIYTAKTTSRLSAADGNQVGPGAYAFDLRTGWIDAKGKHHVYRAVKGQYYKIWINDFRTKDGNIATMLRVAGGYVPGTYVDSVTYNNMGQFPLIGTNMQRTGIFMTTIPSEQYLISKHYVKDTKGAAANPAVTIIENNFVSGKVWIETGAGDYVNSATGPNHNAKDVVASGYKVVMSSLTDQGAKAYDAQVNRLPKKDRAEAARQLLIKHPEYIAATVEGITNEWGRYTLRFPKGTFNKDHLYGYVLDFDGEIVKTYSGFTSPEFRRPNYNLTVTPQTAPYYRPIRRAWVNVNFAVIEAPQSQIEIKEFDATSNPAHRGQTATIDIIGMPKTSLLTRVQWKDSSGSIVEDSGPVFTEEEAEHIAEFVIPSSAKSGEVYTVQLVVGNHIVASDSLIVHVNEEAATYHPIYPSTTVESGQRVTIPAPKNMDGKPLLDGTTFEKGHHVPTWALVNGDGSITVKPGEKVAEGEYDIPVIVTYPDGSKNTIFAPVTVEEKQPMASQYEPITTGVSKPFGNPVMPTDVTDSIQVPNYPLEGQQPTVTVDDESQLPDGTTEGYKDIDVTVTYPDGTKDRVKVPVVTEQQLDSDKYDPVATGILKPFGTPTTEEDVIKLVEIPKYPTDLTQPKVTVTVPNTLPDGQTPGKVDVDVTVTYPDGSTDHISVPVWTNKHLDKDKYNPITTGVSKPFGIPVTPTDVTDSIQVPNYPLEGQQPTVTVDDESQLPDGTTEGYKDIDVTVTYPDGTKDHIKVPVVTEKQPDNEKYEPTTNGITKKYGIPTTEDEVIDIVRIPYFPVDGVQPIVTVNDPRLLPNGQKEGQINVPVTVTYPDGTKDLMTVPVITGKQAENEKYDPITLGVTKDYGDPTTANDVTKSIQIPTYPAGGEQPIATADDESQLPDGTVEGKVDIPVTVTYPDGTQDHITVPVFTNQQRDNQKASKAVTKIHGISVTGTDMTDTKKNHNYPAGGEQPKVTVKDDDQLSEGKVDSTVGADNVTTTDDLSSVTAASHGHQTSVQTTKENQSVHDEEVTIPTVAHVSTIMTGVVKGEQEATDIVARPHVETTRLPSISARATVKQLPETGENNEQSGVLLGGFIAFMGSLLLFGRRRKPKKD
ncbi:LPXTG-anchored surface protein SpsM [Staphylococcus pseudintermedius]|uniref:LPXTG-anchored surface protein SpsM n=1 Tax=Staphylococcus pseudintermedius TaxID=283734 RepID=UPI001BDEC1C1|nr:LPXTG-anchored surface protein SpsM [Staphylococcus pseudintermedius]EIE3768826.1 YPDG domain-containing protein [Staphylococcus pseudintermedius]EJA1916817.1 YPDG domain-containing protein [Staphylococcus pseudintermedius]EJA1936733.1 YPDG domain-containing protein [Staphylococcus pseudintermedius]EJJ6363699.1 YPDG domain-containing protein [Staphylococcus pseudintermedius]ELK4633088.1 YPDG domain-containing protein [Staphylococcus pseudintermedius]